MSFSHPPRTERERRRLEMKILLARDPISRREDRKAMREVGKIFRTLRSNKKVSRTKLTEFSKKELKFHENKIKKDAEKRIVATAKLMGISERKIAKGLKTAIADEKKLEKSRINDDKKLNKMRKKFYRVAKKYK